MRRIRTRRLAAIAAAAIAAATGGCGLTDPMSQPQTTPTTSTVDAPAPSSSTTPPSVDPATAAKRFAAAYVALLNDGGMRAEDALRAAAAPELAEGLILATQDAQLAGDASVTASTRLIALKPAAGDHWRAVFATGTTRWAMLLDIASSNAAAIVVAAATEPAD